MSRQVQLDAICALLVALGLTEAEATQVQSAINTNGPSESMPDGTLFTSPVSSAGDLQAEDTSPPVVVAPLPTPVQAAITAVTPPDHAPSAPTPVEADITAVIPPALVEIDGALTTYPGLPVSSLTVGNEVRYQQTYNGFRFDIPRAGSGGPFYVVTCGKRVGAFSTWHHTSGFVTGVSRACYTRRPSLHAAITRMLDAIDLGAAECIP